MFLSQFLNKYCDRGPNVTSLMVLEVKPYLKCDLHGEFVFYCSFKTAKKFYRVTESHV